MPAEVLSSMTKRFATSLLAIALLALCACSRAGDVSPATPAPMSDAMKTALQKDDVVALRKLLDAGESKDAMNEDASWPAITQAAIAPEGRCLDLLIERGADLDLRVEDRKTAMMMAAMFGFTRNVLALLDAGANERNDPEGWTPLAVAAFIGKVELAEALLKRSADPFADAGTLGTPLHAAARALSGHDAEMTALLLRYVPPDSNIDPKDTMGFSPLAVAVSSGSAEAVRLLLDAGADPNFKLDGQGSVLHLASYISGVDEIAALVKAGADVNVVDASRHTPLHKAIMFGNVENAKCLIDAGAELDVRDEDGNTPLHLAAHAVWPKLNRETRIACVDLLVSRGADKTIKNNDGDTPLDLAVWLEVRSLLKDD